MKNLLITIALLSIGSMAYSQPFGVSMGMSLEQLQSQSTLPIVDRGNGIYEFYPKSAHSAFESYHVLHSKESGVGKIRAVGKTIRVNNFGTQLKDATDTMAEALTGVYGAFKKHDFLTSGSIWRARNEWMWGLYKGERFYVYIWQTELPHDIKGIALIAEAQNTAEGYVSLEYEFTNFETVRNDNQKVSSGAL